MDNAKTVQRDILRLMWVLNSVSLVLAVWNRILTQKSVNSVLLGSSLWEVPFVNLVLQEKSLPMEGLVVVCLVVLEWKLIRIDLNVFSVNLDFSQLEKVNVSNVQKALFPPNRERKSATCVLVVLNPTMQEPSVNFVVKESTLLVTEAIVNNVL